LPQADDTDPRGSEGTGGHFAAVALWDWDLTAESIVWNASTQLWHALCNEAPPHREAWLALLPPTDAAALRGTQLRAFSGGASQWTLVYRLRSSGTRLLERAFVARDETGPVRVVGTLELAQDRPRRGRSIGQELEHSEERFRTFVESLPQLAWQAAPDGWITYYNQRWYDYTGTTPAEMLGWGWITVHDPRDLPRMLKVFRRSLEECEPWEDEFRLRRGCDGMLRWHLSRAIPVRDRQGRIMCWFGTNTDIHEQKLALEERSALLTRERVARSEAEAASRAKDEFLAIVSHELRTPLNAILGWAQLLTTVTLSPEKQREALTRIESSARLQARLIEDLLDASRIIGGKLSIQHEPVDLAQVVHQALETLRQTAEKKGVALCVVGELPKLTVDGSPERLQQVVSNLVDNAIKFSEPGQAVDIALVREGDEVCLQVLDRGVGIDPAYLPRLFERFGQADTSTTRRKGGLGLGLSIVHHLVRLHDGRVEARSDGLGHGARFLVYLPRRGSTGQVRAVAPLEVPTHLRGIDVLAVDDDESARDILGAVLLEYGATVTVVASASEALEVLRSTAVDVIVSDIGMPEIDGFGFVERVRGHENPKIAALPIIALTAYASTTDRAVALAEGFDDYVTKPLEASRLAGAISATLRKRSLG